ncbi:MAG: lytic transglycosylase domain-containing protein [Rhizobiaceae bacterium]
MSVFTHGRLALIAVASLLLASRELTNPGLQMPTGEAPDIQTTASIPRATDIVDHKQETSPEQLKAGLASLASGNISEVRAIRDLLPPASLDRHILEWALAMRGGAQVQSSEIRAARQDLRGWPGADTLQRNAEQALFAEQPAPQSVIEAFSDEEPVTVQGMIILARAYVSVGDHDRAKKLLGPFWRVTKLGPSDEVAILREFGDLIDKADHRFRMERMLYAERIASAERVAERAQAEPLLAAWTAVTRNRKDALKLLAAVPANERSAGYLFAQAQHLRRSGDFVAAAKIMDSAPKDRESLVDPDAWWVERRVLSRELMDAEDMQRAYDVASRHASESPANVADAEFHAGWYALRGLHDAALAETHFSRIVQVVEGPISSARANYWLGRAAESGGPGNAEEFFRRAAAYGTTFYGQLAAQKIGQTRAAMADPEPSLIDRQSFARREPVLALARLEEAGNFSLADRLYRDLAEQIASPGELALLAERAQARGNHFLALRVAKIASSRGMDVGGLSHPVGAIPASADIGSAGMALAYAIARQESEFNAGAVSGAGARGLLQLLPDTAKEVARKNGLQFSPSRLTTDPGYNATLGAAYLGDQLKRFDGSYILTFAG